MLKKGIREAFKKKIAEKETLVHMGGRGVKKSPFFSSSKRGHILMEGGVKIFFSHVPYSILLSVSTQFAVGHAIDSINMVEKPRGHLRPYNTELIDVF